MRGDRRDYRSELEAIGSAIESAPEREFNLDEVEITSFASLRRAVQRREHHYVVLAGHGPQFDLFEAKRAEHLSHCAAVLAELIAISCAPNVCVLLMGCRSSVLCPSLVARGLRGVSFDTPVSSAAIHAFLAGYFDCICARRGHHRAFDVGCITMSLDHVDALPNTRLFGPEFDPERGHYHDWLVPPISAVDDEPDV